ncbi:MAG: cupredoxin domain-containing protein [Thermomicrobiales bacterium]
MKSVRVGLMSLGIVSLCAGTVPALAQDVPDTSFSARIVAGSCDDLAQEPVTQLADLTYGVGEETGTNAASGATALAGSPGTVLVATSVTRLDTAVQDLTGSPHAVAVFSSPTADAMDAVACGLIGGVTPEQNLFFGLTERNDSGYAGVGWLNSGDTGALLTLMLTSLTAPEAGVMPAMATPESAAATPTTMSASVTPSVGGAAATPMTAASEATPAMAGSAASPMAAASPAGSAASAAGTPAATPASSGAAAAQPVTIEAVDIDFRPSEATIPANTDVTIDLPNNGSIVHTFVINDKNNPDVPNLDIRVEMAPGQTEQVTINAPAGDYYYWCDIPGHEAAGMFGTLHVVQG